MSIQNSKYSNDVVSTETAKGEGKSNNDKVSNKVENSDLKKIVSPTEPKKSHKTKNRSTQTEELSNKIRNNTPPAMKLDKKDEDSGWNINDNKETKSIAEQVTEVAQDALKQSGMVYVESAGMYYDYKTGYYYNSVRVHELNGLIRQKMVHI